MRNKTSLRRLTPALRAVDAALARWAAVTGGEAGPQGYPRASAFRSVGHDPMCKPYDNWSEETYAIEWALTTLRELSETHANVLIVEYCDGSELPRQRKAAMANLTLASWDRMLKEARDGLTLILQREGVALRI